MSIRQRGLVFAIGGAVLTTAAYLFVRVGLAGVFNTVGVMMVFAPPAMVTVGIAMLVAPGDHSDLDFGDWLDSQPLRRRVGFYACGALGLAIGGVLLLVLGDWSIAGVIDIVL